MNFLGDEHQIETFLRNASDRVFEGEDGMDAQAAERADRASQIGEAMKVVKEFMNRVYEVAPNIEDGVDMKLVIRGGRVGCHPRHDYEMFQFTAKTTEPQGYF
jgi:hypothetical protein